MAMGPKPDSHLTLRDANMLKPAYVTVVAALVVAIFSVPYFTAESARIPTTNSIAGKSPNDFITKLPDGGRKLDLPVLYEFCGIPMIMVEPAGDGLKHYSGDALKRKLESMKDEPFLSNEVTRDQGMKCLKGGKEIPKIDSLPHRDKSVPEDGPAKEWSA